MAGPNEPFNNKAAPGRDPDPMSFPPITAGPVANFIRGLGKEAPLIVTTFMERMEAEIRSGKRKREDGYIGVLELSPRPDRLPANQLVVVYEDIPGERYGKLMVLERTFETERTFNQKKLDPREKTFHGLDYSGDGYYMANAGVFYHLQGNYVNMGGQPLSANGANGKVDPNSPIRRLKTHGPDQMYQALMQQVDPQKFGLPRDLAQQVKTRIPQGAIPLSVGSRPGAAGPGGGIPGSIDIDSVPDAPAPAASAPVGAAPAPARPAGPALPLVNANGQVNLTGLASAMGDQVRSTLQNLGKPRSGIPRPDQEGP
jgi:hypothetical protein